MVKINTLILNVSYHFGYRDRKEELNVLKFLLSGMIVY